jgi:hypothetical protein
MVNNSIEVKNYWINQRKTKFENLFVKLDEFQIESRNVLQSSLLVMVSILGITTSFSSQNKQNVVNWKITWACMIITIVYGILLLVLEHYLKKKYEFLSGLQQADLAEIEIKTLEGKISREEKEKLILAAVSILDPFDSRKNRWSKEGKKIIKAYRPKLFWSGKIHKKLLKVSKVNKFAFHHFKQGTALYYVCLCVSFAALGYALLMN